MRASEIRELLKLIEKKKVISLAGGIPDPSLFPIDDLTKITQEIIINQGQTALQYAPTKGVTIFRETLVDFIRRMRGIRVPNPECIVVTAGSQQALDIIGRVFINPGDVVLVELPSYLAAINAFRVYNPLFVGIPMDENGLRTDILEEKLKILKNEGKNIKFLYTVPTAHNPTGLTMSIDRRKHLIELANKYDFLIVEDDVYGSLIFENVDVTPIKALDKNGRVIYVSSFSKILAPGLRLGYVVAEEPITDIFEKAKQSLDLHASTLSQFIAMEAIRRGVIEKNLPRIRSEYRKKRDIMLDALEENFPKGCSWSRPIGGMFIFIWLPEQIKTHELLSKAIERGVVYVPGRPFFVDSTGENTMRLSYSYPSEENIRKGVGILGSLIKEELK